MIGLVPHRNEELSRSLQVEEATVSQDVSSERSMRLFRIGLGLTVNLVLFAVMACAVAPLVSHDDTTSDSARTSHHVQALAFQFSPAALARPRFHTAQSPQRGFRKPLQMVAPTAAEVPLKSGDAKHLHVTSHGLGEHVNEEALTPPGLKELANVEAPLENGKAEPEEALTTFGVTKWPDMDRLGLALYNELKPALEQLASGSGEFDAQAQQGLATLQTWLDAPCVAIMKFDGTNFGISDDGSAVGRNKVLVPGKRYQRVDIEPLLERYTQSAGRMRTELANAAAGEAVGRTMLYGELVVNDKNNNNVDVSTVKQWLCFGVLVVPGANDDRAAVRLASALRAAGFNTRVSTPGPDSRSTVMVVPNAKLAWLLQKFLIPSLFQGYRPGGQILKEAGRLDGTVVQRFESLRQLVLSSWAQDFLLPADGVALGEGLVVASESDGKLFKWKHASQDTCQTGWRMAEAKETLRGIAGTPQAERLPPGLLDIFERLYATATVAPTGARPEAKDKSGSRVDIEAVAVWERALTKIDSLESAFEQGEQVRKVLQAELIDAVASDLVEEYCANEIGAKKRAERVVSSEMGKRLSEWGLGPSRHS